jgi:hypothetical protein
MSKTTSLKQQLYSFCIDYVESKLANLQSALASAREAVSDDSKSTAGDKHETGRAMAQLEQEKLSSQFIETEKLQQLLSKLNPNQTSTEIGLGSIVYTTTGNYFIAISAGKVELENHLFYIVSPSSPIGVAFIKANQKSSIEFNGNKIQITKVE